MSDTGNVAPELVRADDGQLHTRECVVQGWHHLDWDADCVHVGIPKGGPVAAAAERALFAASAFALDWATLTPRARKKILARS